MILCVRGWFFRQSLLGGPMGSDPFSSGRGDTWADQDPFQGVTSSDLQSQQQQILREQDTGLEALSHVIGRQKQMAIDIGNEVDAQNGECLCFILELWK